MAVPLLVIACFKKFDFIQFIFVGVRNKIAMAYDSQFPPEFISAANSPFTSIPDLTARNIKSVSLWLFYSIDTF